MTTTVSIEDVSPAGLVDDEPDETFLGPSEEEVWA